MGRAERSEQNMEWVRARTKALGLTEEIARLAYVRYVALYMTDQEIGRKFDEITGAFDA